MKTCSTKSWKIVCGNIDDSHPVVYLKAPKTEKTIICPYCRKIFIYDQ